MTDSTPGFTPEQAQEATAPQREARFPMGTAVPPETPLRVAAGASPGDTDVNALLAQMNAQMQAMAAQIAGLKANQAPQGEHPLVGAALSARDQLGIHFSHKPHPASGDVLRLADDVIDAARNAVVSGETGVVRGLGERLTRAIGRAWPGPGQHHYLEQALQFARDHLADAADTVTAPQPVNAAALEGGAAVPVLAGSVTG